MCCGLGDYACNIFNKNQKYLICATADFDGDLPCGNVILNNIVCPLLLAFNKNVILSSKLPEFRKLSAASGSTLPSLSSTIIINI